MPSIFIPLHDTRMEHQTGVTRTRQLSPLQWQLMMKCWKHNLRPDQYSWWGPMTWRAGSIFMWLYRLRKLNGPNFTWPTDDVRRCGGDLPEKSSSSKEVLPDPSQMHFVPGAQSLRVLP